MQSSAAMFLTYFATLFCICSSCPFLHQESENSANTNENHVHANIALYPIPTFRTTSRPTTLQPKKSPTAVPVSAPTAVSVCKKTKFAYPTVTAASTCTAYKQIRADFIALLPPGGTSAGDFTRANIFGKALRLAFHDAGEIDITQPDKLGPDGCLSNTAENAGLIPFGTVTSTMVDSLFEPIYQKYCDNLNRADFFVLFAKFAVEYSEPTKSIKIPFQYGRRESQSCAGPGNSYVGRDPSGQAGVDEMVETFINNMGLTNVDIVTLLGGHTLGHVHKDFSGYDGTFDILLEASNDCIITNKNFIAAL
mmetsp:Transcript_26684/g.36699  ORF Transcript_26684/g.36699 Transcript_26684/m.36699 type:complete len:308 (-) Transcript_26684:1955-2878(-)